MRVTQVPLLHHAAGALRADTVLIMNRDDLNGQQSIYSLNVFNFEVLSQHNYTRFILLRPIPRTARKKNKDHSIYI